MVLIPLRVILMILVHIYGRDEQNIPHYYKSLKLYFITIAGKTNQTFNGIFFETLCVYKYDQLFAYVYIKYSLILLKIIADGITNNLK